MIIVSLISANIMLDGRIGATILYIPFLVIILILLFASYLFYIRDGGIHNQLYTIIEDTIDDFRTNHIAVFGTGNGDETINIAKRHKDVYVTGIGFLQDNESIYRCQDKAIIEGVFRKVSFQSASPDKLEFSDNYFDVIINYFSFSELNNKNDSFDIFYESFRVLNHSGQFIFIDMFKDQKIYGEYDTLLENMKNMGADILEISDLKDKIVIPELLMNKKFLGNAQIIIGQKI